MRLTKTPTITNFAPIFGQSFNQFTFISRLTPGVFCELIIISLGFFLRFYQLESRAGFDFDQETAAWWIKNLVVDHKISLIGQEISVGGVYIAPFFYYLLTPFYLATKLYPIGGNIFATVVSVLTMIAIYLFAKRIFNPAVAAISTFLYAIHPGIIAYDRTVAPSNLIILLSVSLASILTKVHKKNFDFLLLGIILGMTFSVHPTAILLLPITAVYFFAKRGRANLRQLLLVISPIIALVSPLILFDLRHGGLIAHNIFSALFTSSDARSFNLLTNLVSKVELLLVYWAGTLVSSDSIYFKTPLFILATWILIKTRSLILRIWIFVSLVALVLYPRHVPEYYFLLITPIVLVHTVGFLQKSRLGKIILIIIVAVSMVLAVTSPKANNQLGLYYKNEAVKYIISQAQNRPFTVYYSNEPGEAFGFSYLFWLNQAKIIDNAPKKFLVVIPLGSRVYHPSVDFGRIKVVPLQ